jgi:hypothetical protein
MQLPSMEPPKRSRKMSWPSLVSGKGCLSWSLPHIVGSNAWAICFAWGCSFPFRSTPSCPLLDMADYRLTTFMHVHVFHGDLLLAASSVALKSFHLGGERPSQLVKRPFCAVLLFDRFRVV